MTTNGLRTAYVYVRDSFAGILSETDRGYSFTYDEGYLSDDRCVPVSLTLPLRREPYESKSLFPFFDGLIPEGWLLDIVVSNWKLDPNDRFGQLMVSCRDCIGAVSIRGGRE